MALRSTGVLGLAFASILGSGLAQSSQPTTPMQQGPPADEVDRQVVEMRRQMVEGRVYRTHVRVTVRLKNGNRIVGVVKDGFVVERIDGMRFVAAEASEAGAGMRLYYWNGRRNYVFLPFTEIQEYRISERLTSQQLAAIEREARAQEVLELQKEREAAAAAAAAAAQNQPAASPTPLGEGESPQDPQSSAVPATPAGGEQPGGLAGELQALFALTQEFPPSAGWNETKRDEIKRRMAVVGAKPSAQEQKFVERFADWQRACTLFGVKMPKAEGEGAGASRGGERAGAGQGGDNAGTSKGDEGEEEGRNARGRGRR
jgi:hypothetical protein